MRGRVARFLAVGAIGLALQIGAMALFTSVLGWPYLLATALAVETAVLHNFRWHESWTWRDRTAARHSSVGRRLLRYHATTGATSAAGNLLLTAASVEGFGLHPLPANLAAVACLGAVNFLIADRWVFDPNGVGQGSATTRTPADSSPLRTASARRAAPGVSPCRQSVSIRT
jgi:putative flippase GtrA